MPNVNPTYLAGYKGTVILGGVTTYPILGWSSDADPGAWESTNSMTNGWKAQECGIQSISFSFSILAKAGTGGGIPALKQGDTVAATFTINGTDAAVGEIFISKFSTKVDLKGGVQFDITADSQGPMTGTLAVTPTSP